MTDRQDRTVSRRVRVTAGVAVAAVAFYSAGLLVFAGGAQAVATVPPLGTALDFSVLAGTTVTNTGPSTVELDLGVSPGAAVVGFPPGTVGGAIHAGDAVALQAQDDLTTAYNQAANQPSEFATDGDLGGDTLIPGVYTQTTGNMGLTGALTLNGQNDPDAVWVFQASSTLITASGSSVVFINGADPCNVFWQVGSSATIGTDSAFAGNIMALTSITMQTGATLEGRALARNGAVTMDTNVITSPDCAPPTTTTTTTTETTTTTTTTGPTDTTTGPTDTTTGPSTTTTGSPNSPSTPPTSTTTGPPTTTTGSPNSPSTPPSSTTPGGPSSPNSPNTPQVPTTPNGPVGAGDTVDVASRDDGLAPIRVAGALALVGVGCLALVATWRRPRT